MTVDVGALLRELGFSIAGGRADSSWLLLPPEGGPMEVLPTAPAQRLSAHAIRRHLTGPPARPRPLLIGRSATPGVIQQARDGQIDVLTEEPIQLIHRGRVYAAEADQAPLTTPRPRQRPAWTRWAIERHLLIVQQPARQLEIAAALGRSQQSVSQAAHHLGDLVTDRGDGLVAADRAALLAHWLAEYPGAARQELGWYSLEPISAQTDRAAETAAQLELDPLVSGDVAADRLAPWKLPARSRIYVQGPVDLSGDGFVPAPLEDATLITCVSRDPSLWALSELHPTTAGSRLADPVTVCWDLTADAGLDSAEAAEHLAWSIAEGIG